MRGFLPCVGVCQSWRLGSEVKHTHCSPGAESLVQGGLCLNAQERAETPAWRDEGTDLRRAEVKLATFQLESDSSHNKDPGQDSAYTG